MSQENQEKKEAGYPKFLYHKEHGGKLLHSKEEEVSLGKGWEDSPAKFGIETHPSEKKTEIFFGNDGKETKKEVETSESKPAKSEKGK